MRVLHITPHLGGGVGTVVLAYLENVSSSTSDTHILFALDSINPSAKARLQIVGIESAEDSRENLEQLNEHVKKSDIVLIHWWNHPLLSELLINYELPPSRVAIWAHISGSQAPNNFTRQIFKYPDLFVFTTPLSFLDPEYRNLTEPERKIVRAIWSTGGVERMEPYYQPRSERNIAEIGYVGNLDYAKLNLEFVNCCERINLKINESVFTVIGPQKQKLSEDVSKSRIGSKIFLTGYVSEEEKLNRLSRFGVFGYPLAAHHYGTCDQAIQEAMALGVPVVVLANKMESFMVEHGVTGYVAQSIDEYVDYVVRLAQDVELNGKIGSQARAEAKQRYSLQKMVMEWQNVFTDLVLKPKTTKKWPKTKAGKYSGAEIFVESLGKYGALFEDLILTNSELSSGQLISQIRALSALPHWSSNTKSTPKHFASFFPEDQYLAIWGDLTYQKTE